MNTSRLTINNIDLSTTLADESSAVVGYTVVKSSCGSKLPVKFSGSSRVSDFRAIFGEGGKGDEDVYEALTFLNAGYDLYVSAPYDSASIPYALVTDRGIFMARGKMNYADVEDFAVNGNPANPTYNPGDYALIEASHLSEYFGGRVSISNITTGGFTIETSGGFSDALYSDIVNSGTASFVYCYEDGSYSDVFSGTISGTTCSFSNPPAVGSEIFETAKLYIQTGSALSVLIDGENPLLHVKGYIFPKFPEGNVDVSFAPRSQYSDITINDINSTSISFGLNNVDASQVYLCYLETDPSVSISANVTSYAALSFRGATKSLGDNEQAILENGWTLATDIDDSIDLFFDPACHDIDSTAPKGAFFGLASQNKYLGLAGYIFNATVAPNKEATAPVLSYGANYWSICNQAVINAANSANAFYSSMVGARAAMQAKIIEGNYGGSAPMYLNDASGLGGQLGSLVGSSKLRYSFKDPALRKRLANKNYNVIIQDPNYGILVTSQMTCKTGTLTDWSYIGHVCSFLNFEKLVWDNVMVPQIGKANNPYYRDLRAQQVQTYLDARTGGSNSIWAAATVDTSTAPGVNDVAAQKARKFVIVVKVKVNIFSEEVVLNFVNLPQDSVI